jgi:lipopolysaccharide transport system ATP-binding protein
VPEAAIRVHGLSKLYRIGEGRAATNFREAIAVAVKAPFRRGRRAPRDTIWALRDVSFEIAPGEVVGVIGRNGAGKSTLLKILSRITEPTEGRVELHGRVGSLLEVGTGFHSELTGRENIFLNGAILGMKRAEIARKFDEIVAFAEVERFIDTPVKHYSSGMYLRLAFAVAAHLEPEILLVDEVLAVGDIAFQKKCMGKMGDVAKGGRTVLFVSHNLQVIAELTKRTLVVDHGSLLFSGDRYEALERYRRLFAGDASCQYSNPAQETGLVSVRVTTSTRTQVHGFGKPLIFEFEIRFREKPGLGAFSFQIADESGRPIAHLWVTDSTLPWSRRGDATLRCEIPHPRLYMGTYSLNTILTDRASLQSLERLTGICSFEVVMDEVPREYEWMRGTCTYLEDGEWST